FLDEEGILLEAPDNAALGVADFHLGERADEATRRVLEISPIAKRQRRQQGAVVGASAQARILARVGFAGHGSSVSSACSPPVLFPLAGSTRAPHSAPWPLARRLPRIGPSTLAPARLACWQAELLHPLSRAGLAPRRG